MDETPVNTETLNPGPILTISGSYWQTCALHAGVVTEIFTAMDKGPATSDTIARRIIADARATEMLLNALAAMGLAAKKDGVFENTAQSAAFLVKDAPRYVGHMIMHHHFLVESWSRLHEAVRTGGPVRDRPQYDNEARRESFLMGMFNLASAIAPRVAADLDLRKKSACWISGAARAPMPSISARPTRNFRQRSTTLREPGPMPRE